MTLVQLEYIVAVGTYKSFVIAAEKCFVTQPTLSVQVQKLEDSLGVKIFDRSKQPISPTDIGIKIIEQAGAILSETVKLREIVSDHKNELSGELKIGVIPTVAPYLFPQITEGFLQKFPKIQLIVWEYTTDQIIQNIKLGLLDCGILSTPVEDKALKEIPIYYEGFVAYGADQESLKNKKEIDPSDIDIENLWLLNEGHCMRNQILNLCHKRKQDAHKILEYNTGNIETLKRLVDVKGGITILPELSIAGFSQQQLERIKYFKSPGPVREISIVTPRSFAKRTLITALQTEILEVVPERMQSANNKEVMRIFV
jgi:LysR family hydrogen peroxide-inducible transcriptional activator